MYKNEFDKLLQQNKLSNSFILFGESSFLIDMYIDMLSNIPDASKLSLYYDEYDISLAKSHLSQGSLFGGVNLLVVKNDKKIPKKELDTILELCVKNPDNVFIFGYYGDDYKTYNNAKSFVKYNTMCVRFFHPRDYEAKNILMQIAQQKGIDIDVYTINHLLNLQNGDIALCVNELNKLSIYDTKITTKEIDQLVYGLGHTSTDELMQKILNKQEFITELKKLLEFGMDEIRFLTSLTSFLTQLYMFNIYIRVHGVANAKEILGYSPPKNIVDVKARLSLKFKPQTYYKLHKLLLKSELKLKSASVDKEAILFSTILKLQKLI